ncbi:ficolin-1-like [Ixodes scapularis]|uniref:ficolin-1-like n=1 Tax=Ixodes scapularis TaxID=6945 RepID=UPI001C38EA14|nr:ficolin-1-like [Ixodes scapularis]XP_042144150.1 ficolin-1-like [Ixodes scapularis]XP_042145740.1 ficolin-1-like [Ixodes scapularis]
MFVVSLFIPLVAGNVFMESSIRRVPEITERQHTPTKIYMIFDPCNTNKPGNRTVSCSQIKMRERSSTKTKYTIYPRDKSVDVECDMETDGGGWTVIQRRSRSEAENNYFEKDIKHYESGFKTQGGASWIGLDNLHALTSFPNNQQALRIELTKIGQREPTVLLYHKFVVGSKQEGYKLTVADYEGPHQDYDALSYHNGQKFTVKKSMTQPPDGDRCSARLSGGWWFKDCNEANLNGRKFTYTSPTKALGITWHIKGQEESYYYPYDSVEMKIRDYDYGFCTGAFRSKRI